MNRKARRAAAKDSRRRSEAVRSGAASPTAGELLSAAFRHQQAGQWTDATSCYERALAIEPAHALAHNALGNLLLVQDRPADARASFEQALALDPSLVAAHINLGNLLRGEGDLDRAIDCFLRAIELQPDQMDAHNNLCALLLSQGKFEAVAAHFEEILAVKPDYAPGYNTLAVAHLGAGHAPRALEVLLRALAISETAESRALFVLALQSLKSVPASEPMRGLLVRAMTEPWGRPGDLSRHCIGVIKAAIGDDIGRAARAWPERLPADQLFGPSGPGGVSRDRVLLCLLENARADDVDLERYLTSARLALLEAASSASPQDKTDDDMLAFYGALARQCFINEYVYAQTDREQAQFEALRKSLQEALRARAPAPALWPVAVAAYVPLHRLEGSGDLLARQWPQPIDALLTQQMREPIVERALRDTIPRLTPIDDAVSVMVQEQYEENPYPRWVKVAPASRPVPIDARLRSQFPLSRFRNLGKTSDVDVLVAGCGTGQQLVDVSRRIVGARVLAIDLSRASLAYARRQTEALGIRNIEYGQADILRLGELGRQFDVIDCGGVLHHLRDPIEGGRVLRSILRPHGVMRLALYSETARPHIVAARAFIAERGYRRDPGEIRRFRQDVLALPDGDLVKLVTQSPDFFSISDCRDLVFHVQEHRFTLPQIKDFLAESDLEFLGFEIDFRLLGRYGAQFPEDPARTDLARWHAFEQAHRFTFSGMYQFWVQRRG